MAQPGWAIAEGTAKYRKRFDGKIPHGHFRTCRRLWARL